MAERDELLLARTEVRPLGDKGLGTVAVEHIAPGQVILRDTMILGIHGMPSEVVDTSTGEARMLTSDEVEANLQADLERRSVQEQSIFWELADAHVAPVGEKTVTGVVRTNALPVHGGVDDPGLCAGIFPVVSRLNHSCTPNAHVEFRKELDAMLVHADAAIQEGEEVCISYIHVCATCEERQELLSNFCFVCRCSACSAEGEALVRSDARRVRLRELQQKLSLDLHASPETPEACEAEALRIIDAELLGSTWAKDELLRCKCAH